jgi:hypothetical protein
MATRQETDRYGRRSAVIQSDGTQHWYREGRRHRDISLLPLNTIVGICYTGPCRRGSRLILHVLVVGQIGRNGRIVPTTRTAHKEPRVGHFEKAN